MGGVAHYNHIPQQPGNSTIENSGGQQSLINAPFVIHNVNFD